MIVYRATGSSRSNASAARIHTHKSIYESLRWSRWCVRIIRRHAPKLVWWKRPLGLFVSIRITNVHHVVTRLSAVDSIHQCSSPKTRRRSRSAAILRKYSSPWLAGEILIGIRFVIEFIALLIAISAKCISPWILSFLSFFLSFRLYSFLYLYY